MTRSYGIRRWDGARPEIADRVFDPDAEAFCALPYAPIDQYVWDESGYRPEARAYVARTADGLLVLMCAKEETTAAVETRFGGDVFKDSCLEFFLGARPSEGARYLNVEVNVAGVAHIGLGTGRHDRRVLDETPEGMTIEHSRHAGAWWAVCYNLPNSLIRASFGGDMEREMRANFYCIDMNLHPHCGSWNAILSEKPDFHQPEFFGCLRMEG